MLFWYHPYGFDEPGHLSSDPRDRGGYIEHRCGKPYGGLRAGDPGRVGFGAAPQPDPGRGTAFRPRVRSGRDRYDENHRRDRMHGGSQAGSCLRLMAIVFEEYTESRIPAVRDLNRRLVAALDEDMRFPEHPLFEWLPKGAHPVVYHQAFL